MCTLTVRRAVADLAVLSAGDRCPESVHFRVKPVIGGTYGTLKEKLTGLGGDFQVTDRSELAFEIIKKALF